MKTICFNKQKTKQYSFYGIWGLISISLIVLLVADSIEFNTIYLKWGINEYNGGDYAKFCYVSVLTGNEVCDCWDICIDYVPHLRTETTLKIIAMSADIVFSVSYFYVKQSWFKIIWCKKALQNNDKVSLK